MKIKYLWDLHVTPWERVGTSAMSVHGGQEGALGASAGKSTASRVSTWLGQEGGASFLIRSRVEGPEEGVASLPSTRLAAGAVPAPPP